LFQGQRCRAETPLIVTSAETANAAKTAAMIMILFMVDFLS
jgi:hypothetical protein